MSYVPDQPTAEMWIDVVDSHDRKVGEIERADALRAGITFHTAHLFLFGPDGRLLLQQLAAERERHPLRWGASVAGYLFAGETYDAAIRRRASQELGIDVEPHFVGKIVMTDERSSKFVALYEATHGGRVSPDPGHIETVRFAAIADIAEEIATAPETFTPTFRNLFHFYTTRTAQ